MYVNALYEAYSTPGLAGLRQCQSTHVSSSSRSSSAQPAVCQHDVVDPLIHTMRANPDTVDVPMSNAHPIDRRSTSHADAITTSCDQWAHIPSGDARCSALHACVAHPIDSRDEHEVDHVTLAPSLQHTIDTAHRVRTLLLRLNETCCHADSHDAQQHGHAPNDIHADQFETNVKATVDGIPVCVGVQILSTVQEIQQDLSGLLDSLNEFSEPPVNMPNHTLQDASHPHTEQRDDLGNGTQHIEHGTDTTWVSAHRSMPCGGGSPSPHGRTDLTEPTAPDAPPPAVSASRSSCQTPAERASFHASHKDSDEEVRRESMRALNVLPATAVVGGAAR